MIDAWSSALRHYKDTGHAYIFLYPTVPNTLPSTTSKFAGWFTMKFTTTIFSIISLISFVATAPVELEKRDVFVPPVLLPDSTSVWKRGSEQTVKWWVVFLPGGCESVFLLLPFYSWHMYDPFIYRNVTYPPKEITNKKGKIILVKNGMLDLGQSETIQLFALCY